MFDLLHLTQQAERYDSDQAYQETTTLTTRWRIILHCTNFLQSYIPADE